MGNGVTREFHPYFLQLSNLKVLLQQSWLAKDVTGKKAREAPLAEIDELEPSRGGGEGGGGEFPRASSFSFSAKKQFFP